MSRLPWLCLLAVSALTEARTTSQGILYPRESESRDVRSLDGVWQFRLSPQDDPLQGYREKWYLREMKQMNGTIPMPVPASYNDITQDKRIRDHVGLVWYERTFFVPTAWKADGGRVWLRFGSVSYSAQVWVNGALVMSHEIGHLPFERDVTSWLRFGAANRLTVSVDNTLSETTVPQGTLSEVITDDGPTVRQSYTFDFFNYAGIHRPVHLYTTPSVFIDDISVHTDVSGETGIVEYNVTWGGSDASAQCIVTLLDASGAVVVKSVLGARGRLEVPQAQLWWPLYMGIPAGYLYTLEVRLSTVARPLGDVYRLPVGIRRVEWNSTSLLVNGIPVYLRGFGRHEDSDLRGKGLDLALVAKDYNLIKWVGANAYRTSHYPYAEEIMDFADQQGIMIIDECPAVDTVGFTPPLLNKHKDSLTQLIHRDKNRPSVIMWSVSNEPRNFKTEAGEYFKSVVEHVKQLDNTRPVTMATATGANQDNAAKYMDVIGYNRYNGWYSNPGRTDMIVNNVVQEAEDWHVRYGKPVMILEYGADTLEGLHLSPEYIWSEEYQVELMSRHFRAFDMLREKGFFVGEMIWNFADFKTAQTYTRVGGNKKGIFTRNRQPKASAHLLRKRYLGLARLLDDNNTWIEDSEPYIIRRSEL